MIWLCSLALAGRWALPEMQVPSSYSAHWQRHPHRLSALVLRPPGARDPSDPGELRLGGGTWANGQRASDQAEVVVGLHLLRGVGMEAVEAELLLTPSVATRPGASELRGALALPEAGGLWIQGLELQLTGPHRSTGATLTHLSLELDGGDPPRELRARLGLGEVPDRDQVLVGVTATLRVYLGLSAAPLPPRARALPGHQPRRWLSRRAPPPLPCAEGEEGLELLQGLHLQIDDPGRHPGRYLRSLSYDLIRGAALFSNFGLITRETHWHMELRSSPPPASWESEPRRCWRGG